MSARNIFHDIPDAFPAELVDVLVSSEYVRIERIVSLGHASPPGFWYEEDENEWVIVLRGSAELRFDDTPRPMELNAGDFVQIDAGRRHRVESTVAAEPTVWLAVFFSS